MEVDTSAASTLRLADQRLRMTAPGDVLELCATVRRTAAALARVDSFYVGLYRGEGELVIPYLFDGGQDLGADVSHYGPNGLSRWVRASAEPYRWQQDDGRLLNGGTTFGEGGQNSADAVCVPMLDPTGRTVLGMLNAQSTEASVYDDRFVAALLWLGRALAVYLDLGSRPSGQGDLYRDLPELDSALPSTPSDLLLTANERFQGISEQIAALQARLGRYDVVELHEQLQLMRQTCLRAAAELAVLAIRLPDGPGEGRDLSHGLTRRETEVATMIATESLSNHDVGRRLNISERTVKTHVSHILRKLDLHQRSEIKWILRDHQQPPNGVRAKP